MSAAREAISKINWATLIPQLGLTGKTATSLAAFKKRNDEAKANLYDLKHQSVKVDYDSYRSKLHNAQIVDRIQSDVSSFKASKPDLDKQLNLISAFEAKAVENAKETESLVLKELTELEKTLQNIETARPFDELTVDDVVKARPDVEDKVQYMLDHGKVEVPGYKEKFGSMVIM